MGFPMGIKKRQGWGCDTFYPCMRVWGWGRAWEGYRGDRDGSPILAWIIPIASLSCKGVHALVLLIYASTRLLREVRAWCSAVIHFSVIHVRVVDRDLYFHLGNLAFPCVETQLRLGKTIKNKGFKRQRLSDSAMRSTAQQTSIMGFTALVRSTTDLFKAIVA